MGIRRQGRTASDRKLNGIHHQLVAAHAPNIQERVAERRRADTDRWLQRRGREIMRWVNPVLTYRIAPDPARSDPPAGGAKCVGSVVGVREFVRVTSRRSPVSESVV